MTDTEMVEGVPTKIVMVGTSNMTLHQRFSRMPKPKVLPNKQAAERPALRGGGARGRMRGQTLASRRAAIMRTQPVFEILEPVVDDFVEEYVPFGQQVRRVAPVLFRRPIEERVTLPPPPQVVYVPVPVRSSRRGVRGVRGRGVQRSSGQRNNVRGVSNNTNFKNRFGAGTGRSGRNGTVGRGGTKRAPPGHYSALPKKTVTQLDRELEEYMRKSKHPKIVV